VSEDPLGLALRELFGLLWLGGTLLPDLVAWAALAAGLAAAVALPLPVRALPAPTPSGSRASRVWRAGAAACGTLVPGAWDLLAGRPGVGALQTLLFGVCYAAARGSRGEGLLASIVLPRPSYFGDVPAGVAYLARPALADAAGLLALALFVANIPVTLWRVRAAGVLGQRSPRPEVAP
jgi:hypothetical protein